MGKIFCIMGKSSTGKDTIYKLLLDSLAEQLNTIVTYTTRPIRAGEEDGREYHFTDEQGFLALQNAGKVIESRVYNTIHGPWRYFTVCDEQINFSNSYLMIGTLEVYEALIKYYGEDKVCPIYIEIDDGVRLERALSRERNQETPKYEELCRRFLADQEDFSEEKLARLSIRKRFINNELNDCLQEISDYIKSQI